MNIKSVILPILFISHSACAVESVYKCDVKVFHALSFRGNKEVSVCLSNGKVSYTYGDIDESKPELDILIKTDKVYWTKYNVNIWDTTRPPGDDYRTINNTIAVTNGHYKYELSSGSIGSNEFDQLIVTKDGKRLDKIKLRRSTVSYHIDTYLEEYGIERKQGNYWGG